MNLIERTNKKKRLQREQPKTPPPDRNKGQEETGKECGEGPIKWSVYNLIKF